MINKDYLYLHALNSVHGIGSQKLELLLDYFNTSEDAWNCTEINNFKDAGLSEKLSHKLLLDKKNINLDKELNMLEKNNISILTKIDTDYPKHLKNIYNAPTLLYTKGNVSIMNEPSVTIVGSRKFTSYGKQATEKIVTDLVNAGIHIVSGLALGIDAISHHTCLKSSGNGKTIAVLGGGIDETSIAPRTNLNLSNYILNSGGVIISDFVPYTKPSKGTFPARNRIMTGITDITLVIEAHVNSGTLITAQLAIDYNKHLFAVPGSIFSQASTGTNNLIKKGHAKILQDASDILNLLNIDKKNDAINDYIPSSEEEIKIFEILLKNPDGLPIDKIIQSSNLKESDVGSTLVLMELDGGVKNLGGNIFTVHT